MTVPVFAICKAENKKDIRYPRGPQDVPLFDSHIEK